MASTNLQACQQDAEEVKVLMKKNVDKIFEREGKLENLEDRSEQLKSMACNFQKTAQTVERKTRWEKYRWYIITGIVVVVIIAIIIIIIASQFSGNGGGGAPAQQLERSEGQSIPSEQETVDLGNVNPTSS